MEYKIVEELMLDNGIGYNLRRKDHTFGCAYYVTTYGNDTAITEFIGTCGQAFDYIEKLEERWGVDSGKDVGITNLGIEYKYTNRGVK